MFISNQKDLKLCVRRAVQGGRAVILKELYVLAPSSVSQAVTEPRLDSILVLQNQSWLGVGGGLLYQLSVDRLQLNGWKSHRTFRVALSLKTY